MLLILQSRFHAYTLFVDGMSCLLSHAFLFENNVDHGKACLNSVSKLMNDGAMVTQHYARITMCLIAFTIARISTTALAAEDSPPSTASTRQSSLE